MLLIEVASRSSFLSQSANQPVRQLSNRQSAANMAMEWKMSRATYWHIEGENQPVSALRNGIGSGVDIYHVHRARGDG